MDLVKLNKKLDKLEDQELKSMILELLEEKEYITKEATIDDLTGVYNRKILEHVTSNAAIVMCDLDGFKKINDDNGHDYGDKVLKTFASRLQSYVRTGDIVCRYGGDEFVLILINCPKEVAKSRLDILIESLVKEDISFSAGISDFNESKSLEEAIKEADKALYTSKASKDQKVTIFNK